MGAWGPAILGVVGGVFGNAVVLVFFMGSRNNKLDTVAAALMEHKSETDRRFDGVGDEQTRQWQEIGKHGQEISYLQGKLNGKAKGAYGG